MTLWTASHPIAIDTNVLIHAHLRDMSKHDEAQVLIRRLAERDAPWGIPVFCIGEFLRVVTHHGLFDSPTPLEEALDAIDDVLGSPRARLLAPGDRYWLILKDVMGQANVSGNRVYDAQIAALCLEHGFQTIVIVSEDRDMRRFEGIEAVPIT